MRPTNEPASGVTYIGPRTFVAGFIGLCLVFGAVMYAAPKIIDAFEPGTPPVNAAGGPALVAQAARSLRGVPAPTVATAEVPVPRRSPAQVAAAPASSAPALTAPAPSVSPRISRPAQPALDTSTAHRAARGPVVAPVRLPTVMSVSTPRPSPAVTAHPRQPARVAPHAPERPRAVSVGVARLLVPLEVTATVPPGNGLAPRTTDAPPIIAPADQRRF